MKKTLFLALTLSTLVSASFAQEAKTAPAAPAAPATPVATVAAAQEDTKTKIDPTTLPDAVKATLATDAYKDWTVATAWSVKAEPAYYALELKKEDKTMTVNITADGKVR